MAFDFGDFISGIFGGGVSTPPTFPTQTTPIPQGTTPPFFPQEDSGGFDFGKLVMPLLLGGGTMLASKLLGAGDQKNIDKAMKQLSGTAGAADIGRKLLDRSAAGKLTDPQQAQVDAMKREQNARNQQYLASLGIPVSTANVQMQNNVDQAAVKLSNDLINQSFDQGIKAMGLGSQSAAYLLQAATKNKTDLANTIGEVAKQIGAIFNQPQRPQPGMTRENRVPIEWTDYGSYPDANEYGY